MNDLYTNAKRMVSLFEQMRHARSSPAFALLKQLNLSFSHMAALRLLAPDRVLTMKASMLTTPGWARRLAGFDHSALGRRLWFEPTMKVQVAAINWAFGVPANRRLAEARTASGALAVHHAA